MYFAGETDTIDENDTDKGFRVVLMGKVMKKVIILGVIFVLAIAGAFILMRRPAKSESLYTTMEEASLPVVYMQVNDGLLNELHGYAQEMDTKTMRDALTPLPEDRGLNISINLYGSKLKGISYEIRSLDTERLVERTSVETWQDADGRVTAVLPIQNLISRNTEYVLGLNLMLDAGRSVYYYTRILWENQSHVGEILNFAKDFSSKTFDRENAAELKTYLESSSQGDNSSLNRVDIHSSFSQVTWGDLAVTRANEPVVTIKELSGPIGNVQLKYLVTAPGDGENVEQYEVRENFCIKWTSQRMYLMAYERTMDQVFDANSSTIGNKRIELGITDREFLDCKFSPSYDYTAFVSSRELWCYKQSENRAVKIFGFRSGSDDGVRTGYRQHNIQLVAVGDNGDVDFLVYGYMNRGNHEGEVGVVFYRYEAEDNATRELFYVPTRKSYQFLKEDMGTLSYVNSAQQLYLLLDHSIYAIDLAGNEFMVIAQGLPDEGYVISESSKMLAWQEGSDVYHSKVLNLMNLDTGHRAQITAEDGELLRALGFVDEDFIYGTAREEDVVRDSGRVVTYPMYALDIVDENKASEAHYEEGGIYINKVTVVDSRIHLSRLSKGEGGEYTPIGAYTLVSNVAEEKTAATGIQTQKNDIKKQVYYISLKNTAEAGGSLKVTAPKRIATQESGVLNLVGEGGNTSADRYYAYANGALDGSYISFKEAVDAVYDSMGLVTNSDQEVIWMRGNRSLTKTINVEGPLAQSAEDELAACLAGILKKEGKAADVSAQLASGKGAMAVLEENLDCMVIDASGCTLNQVLYFVYRGTPVLATLKDGRAVLITGYDQYNVLIYNPQTGTAAKMGQNDATAYFEGQDNRFLCYLMDDAA